MCGIIGSGASDCWKVGKVLRPRARFHIPVRSHEYSLRSTGMAGAFAQELRQHDSLGEAVEGKIFAGFVGWDSVEAHEAFGKTGIFREVIGTLRGAAKGSELHHTVFKKHM
jgi:hypothetical protein